MRLHNPADNVIIIHYFQLAATHCSHVYSTTHYPLLHTLCLFAQQDDTNTWLLDQPEDSLSVEDDELDRHECMLPLVHLIERAAALFPPSHNNAQMLDWMARMHVGVESSQVPKIVRLFLVKALLHVERRHSEREAATQQQAQSPSQVCVTVFL